ncbi:MAG: LPS-assembly protein LptD, partial [Halomonas sp.]
MGKRFSRAVPVAQTLMGSLLASASFSVVAQSEPLSAEALDWQPWEREEAANQLCRGRYVMPGYRLAEQDSPETLAAEATEADYATDGNTILRGDVVLRRADQEVEAERVSMPADRERVNAEGNIAMRDGTSLVRGNTAEIMLNEDRTQLDDSQFVLYDQHLRGQAVQLEQLEKDQYRLQDARFTTCDPGENTWHLVSSDIRLDQAEGFGTARNARLEIKDVPVLYVPWVRFPIDDRRHTGLLTPAIALSGDGFDYTQPFYWNIAPNRDATITPRWMSDHG